MYIRKINMTMRNFVLKSRRNNISKNVYLYAYLLAPDM